MADFNRLSDVVEFVEVLVRDANRMSDTLKVICWMRSHLPNIQMISVQRDRFIFRVKDANDLGRLEVYWQIVSRLCSNTAMRGECLFSRGPTTVSLSWLH
mgnify:CR=1 FL=1